MQLTDLHQWPRGVKEFEARGRVIDFDKEGYSSERNVELIAHVVDRVKPELVILTGEYGAFWLLLNLFFLLTLVLRKISPTNFN